MRFPTRRSCRATGGGTRRNRTRSGGFRQPTLVACSAVVTGSEPEDTEDILATGCAACVVLLAAHGRGLAGYWRTPAVLREPAGRAAVGIPDSERFVGLLCLGHPIQEQSPPERGSLEDTVTHLP